MSFQLCVNVELLNVHTKVLFKIQRNNLSSIYSLNFQVIQEPIITDISNSPLSLHALLTKARLDLVLHSNSIPSSDTLFEPLLELLSWIPLEFCALSLCIDKWGISRGYDSRWVGPSNLLNMRMIWRVVRPIIFWRILKSWEMRFTMGWLPTFWLNA